MMNLSGKWTGEIIGTNIGKVFAELAEINGSLSGKLHVNDPVYGTAVFAVSGSVSNGQALAILTPVMNLSAIGANLGETHVQLKLTNKNECQGEWQSTIGTAGVVILHRVDQSVSPIENKEREHSGNEQRYAFVMMPIIEGDAEVKDTLEAIKRACVKADVNAVRADEIEHSGRITDLVLEKIRFSHWLICDLSKERPNVYYELGYAHGIGKNVILIAKKGTILHFDVKDYNVIFFQSYTDLEQKVEKRLIACKV